MIRIDVHPRGGCPEHASMYILEEGVQDIFATGVVSSAWWCDFFFAHRYVVFVKHPHTGTL